MMRATPRMFVGPVAIELVGQICTHLGAALGDELRAMPGIGRCELDRDARLLLITARQPVDRTSVLDALEALGIAVRT
ncbi:MAG TPA: hypothetical protein VFV89_09435 [Nocardioides sp.]|uniref:hypothetical protein n=1 Tax=Nocardioides sp. TaxID=35761 RepID=UPI002E2F8201|nr:hypothetical protein [Nocardioides sp.]HEX5088021.1 hypothetical protein [Nocardioides sp.]